MIGAPVRGVSELVATRRLVRAIGVLVFGGLHMAFLFGFHAPRPTVEVLAPIEIEVVPKGDAAIESIAERAIVAAVPPTETAPEPAQEEPPDVSPPDPPAEMPTPIAAPGPADAPSVATATVVPEPRPARERRPIERPPKRRAPAEPRHDTRPTKASSPAPAPAEVRAAGAVDGREDLRAARAGYGALVSAEINRHKHYPAAARERGETGTVAVTFVVGPAGTIVSHALRRSSGSRALDAAAEAMLAASRAPPPPGGRFSGSIDINFAIGR